MAIINGFDDPRRLAQAVQIFQTGLHLRELCLNVLGLSQPFVLGFQCHEFAIGNVQRRELLQLVTEQCSAVVLGCNVLL